MRDSINWEALFWCLMLLCVSMIFLAMAMWGTKPKKSQCRRCRSYRIGRFCGNCGQEYDQ